MLGSVKRLFPDRHPLRLLWHRAKALLAAALNGFPARKLTVIAISGTDGKTTTVGMIAHILHATNVPVAAASTAFLQLQGTHIENATHLTSLSPFALQRFLRTAVQEGCTVAVIEMSSHGLVQGRTNYTWPTVAGITNLALEHLDYHGTMERYRADKGRMFRMLGGRGTKVLNGADASSDYYATIPSAQTIVYGTQDGDLYLQEVRAEGLGSVATLVEKSGSKHVLRLSVPGIHNLDNALCAIGCASAVGVATKNAIEVLSTFPGIAGRMERITEGQPFSVIVDFAVSPQAYEKTLGSLRAMVGESGRVLVLCSSCGNRMREKRPQIGQICSTLADVVVATEDETYGEDPHEVLEEVWTGIDQTACEAHKIFDRREAIAFLFKKAQPGDAVVLCGMGPFSTMTKLEGRIPWDERVIARELLQKMRT